MKTQITISILLIGLLVITILYSQATIYKLSERFKEKEGCYVSENKKPLRTPKITLELLRAEIVKQGIYFPDVVLKQAILETGHFTSPLFKSHNNLFGFFNGKRYLYFENWRECVRYCKKFQEKKFKEEYYYRFLNELPYAEDTAYVRKVKRIKIN